MTYKNYTIEPGGLGYLYCHKDYEGVTYLGEDIESADPRCGSAKTIESCKSEIDELEEELEEKRKDKLIQAIGLDPSAPYSLGNKTYYYERKCNSGHENLTDDEIGFAGGYYDGYNWTVPVCLRCVKQDKEYPAVAQHSHNTKVHLKEANPS